MSTRFYRIIRLAAAVVLGAGFTSCTTTYDAYGRPQQSVDPGMAVAGVAAAGVLGYALGNSNDNHHHGNRGYYNGGGGYYRGGHGY